MNVMLRLHPFPRPAERAVSGARIVLAPMEFLTGRPASCLLVSKNMGVRWKRDLDTLGMKLPSMYRELGDHKAVDGGNSPA